VNLRTSILLTAGCLSACSLAHGESLKDTLSQNYKKHVLVLRTPFTQNELKFDSAGRQLNPSPGGKWLTYGGIHVEKLALSKDRLRLEGHRVGFSAEQKNGQPVLITLGKGVGIEIQLTEPLQSADEARAVLDRVFYLDVNGTERARPELRRADDLTSGESIYRVGKDDTKAPTALYTPEPEFSEPARKAKFQGTVRLTIVVDKAGNIARVRLDKALGFGLDENAMETIKSWRFSPATRNGQPVAVEVSTEFSFHLY
jgi:TonB family protein